MVKRICALTMVRNDEFFLRRWVDYYGRQLGKENLYVFFDGTDQKVPEFCAGVNVTVRERVPGLVAAADRGRIDYISERAAGLFGQYDMVIGTDVDEFLVVDPDRNITLPEFLSSLPEQVTYSGLGIDVGQNLDLEDALDDDRSFLSQRRYASLSTRYTKASVITSPVAWGSGFHRVRSHNFHIVKDLYLFHFGCVDMERLKMKLSDSDKIASGWTRHLKKRAATIYAVTRGRARSWEWTVRLARVVQNAIRPPYAWNKPAMFGIVPVVNIPERFADIV